MCFGHRFCVQMVPLAIIGHTDPEINKSGLFCLYAEPLRDNIRFNITFITLLSDLAWQNRKCRRPPSFFGVHENVMQHKHFY